MTGIEGIKKRKSTGKEGVKSGQKEEAVEEPIGRQDQNSLQTIHKWCGMFEVQSMMRKESDSYSLQ